MVSDVRARSLLSQCDSLPHWPAGEGRVKLSAAWLIERVGLKGVREGDAGIAEGHSLVLVNYGHATGDALWALARRVQRAVLTEFGVLLEPEPRVI